MNEFQIIREYFSKTSSSLWPSDKNYLGIGDDCAVLPPLPHGTSWAVTTDMLIAGRHFFTDTEPTRLGHKALAVNLSDLAAMGATPVAFNLALSLPDVQPNWLSSFAEGLFDLAKTHSCRLIGGDTTRGPLSLCITAMGYVESSWALRRDHAQVGDDLWVSGELGRPHWGLHALLGTPWAQTEPQILSQLTPKLEQPYPRVALGQALAALAKAEQRPIAALDLSDGLLGDLRHLLEASSHGVSLGAALEPNALPYHPILEHLPVGLRHACQLQGGDEYELLFCASPHLRSAIAALAEPTQTPITRIGQIIPQKGVWLNSAAGWQRTGVGGWDHFGGVK